MTTERGQVTRTILDFMRKHNEHSLLKRALDRCNRDIANRGLRWQAKFLADTWGNKANEAMQELVDDDEKIDQWAKIIEKSCVRDKLVCAVFNDLFKQAQTVVTKGPEAQLRYFVDKHGMDKTSKLVKYLVDGR